MFLYLNIKKKLHFGHLYFKHHIKNDGIKISIEITKITFKELTPTKKYIGVHIKDIIKINIIRFNNFIRLINLDL